MASAQKNITNSAGPWEVTLATGTLLPMNITGVHEIFGVAALRVSKDVGAFLPEVSLVSGRENGAVYHAGLMSWRGTIKEISLAGFIPHWTLGLHASRYKRPNPQLPFENALGYHGGVGMKMPINYYVNLRTDFYFGLQPGRILIFNIGLSFVLGSPEGKANSG